MSFKNYVYLIENKIFKKLQLNLILHLGLYFDTAVLHCSTRGEVGIGIMLFVSYFLDFIIDYNLRYKNVL